MLKITKLSPVPALFSIILLIIAVNGYIADKNAEQVWPYSQHSLPDGFFTFLRLSMFVTGSYSSFYFFSMNKNVWAWLMVFMALLFNPFVVVHLEHETWVNADAISAGILGFMILPVKVKTTVASIFLKYLKHLLIAAFIIISFWVGIIIYGKLMEERKQWIEEAVEEIRHTEALLTASDKKNRIVSEYSDKFQNGRCNFPGDEVSIAIPEGWVRYTNAPQGGKGYGNRKSGEFFIIESIPLKHKITTKELSIKQMFPDFDDNNQITEREGRMSVDWHDLKFSIIRYDDPDTKNPLNFYSAGFIYNSRLYRLIVVGRVEVYGSTYPVFVNAVKSIKFHANLSDSSNLGASTLDDCDGHFDISSAIPDKNDGTPDIFTANGKIREVYKKMVEQDYLHKDSSGLSQQEVIDAMNKTWAEHRKTCNADVLKGVN